MKRAVCLGLALLAGACLEPGDLSSPDEIYDALNQRDAGGGSGGSGGMGPGGSGGMGPGGSGGMGPGGSGGMGDAATGDCGDVLEDLLKPRCGQSVCHSTEAGGVLDVQAPNIGERLIGTASSSSCDGVPYMDADDPAQSLLYTKLNPNPPCGARMPFSGEPFTEEEQACVLEFIEQQIADQ